MAFDEDEILAGWETARGPHGGYVMALLVRAMERAVDDDARKPRSLTTHFLRPPKVGPITTTATVERAGRSMSTVTARLEQDGKPVALGLGAFSRPYDGTDIGERPMPEVAPPGEPAPPIPGAPPVTERLPLQPRFGDAPFTASHAPHARR